MKYIFKLFTIILIPIATISCGSEPGCGYVDTAYSTYFPCYVYYKATNKTVMSNFFSPYITDFSKLVDENGNDPLINGKITNDGEMFIPIAIEGKDSIGQLITKTYYLHLVDEFKVEKDIDTLKISFELYKADNCHRIDFKNFKCYFNDSLYITAYPWDTYAIILYK